MARSKQGQLIRHLFSLPWSFGAKEGSRERSAKSAPSCQDSRYKGEQSHLYLFIELGKVTEGGAGIYICCLEFIKLAYPYRASWSCFSFD